MEPIQTDVSDEVLVRATRLNLCEFYRHLSRTSPDPSRQFEDEKFTRWHVPIQYPWFNGVLSSRLPEENDDAFIEETIQYFRAKGVGVFTWWLEPPLQRADWEPVLAKHGFGFSDDTPGMAADLETLSRSQQSVDGLEIRVVADEESLHEWARVFTAGYELPPDWETSIYDMEVQLGLDFPLRNYLGYFNSKPVATSSAFFGGGVVGIYSVSTLPEARGKGIGAALTLQPLDEARQLGYRIGVLQSSEMGFSVYKKLGFKHLCQIENFYRGLR